MELETGAETWGKGVTSLCTFGRSYHFTIFNNFFK